MGTFVEGAKARIQRSSGVDLYAQIHVFNRTGFSDAHEVKE